MATKEAIWWRLIWCTEEFGLYPEGRWRQTSNSWAMEQLHCKLIKQHLFLLIYRPDIANAQIPMDIFLTKIISNWSKGGMRGITHTKNKSTMAPNQTHHHTPPHGWTYRDLGRKKIFLTETKGHICKYFSRSSSFYIHQFWTILPILPFPPPPFITCFSWLLGHLIFLVVFLSHGMHLSVSFASSQCCSSRFQSLDLFPISLIP